MQNAATSSAPSTTARRCAFDGCSRQFEEEKVEPTSILARAPRKSLRWSYHAARLAVLPVGKGPDPALGAVAAGRLPGAVDLCPTHSSWNQGLRRGVPPSLVSRLEATCGRAGNLDWHRRPVHSA
eukprot:351801-Chlamydomonas_euryale.AAC.21